MAHSAEGRHYGEKEKNHNDTIFIFILGYYLKDTIMFLVKNDHLVHFWDKIYTQYLQGVNFWKKSDFLTLASSYEGKFRKKIREFFSSGKVIFQHPFLPILVFFMVLLCYKGLKSPNVPPWVHVPSWVRMPVHVRFIENMWRHCVLRSARQSRRQHSSERRVGMREKNTRSKGK